MRVLAKQESKQQTGSVHRGLIPTECKTEEPPRREAFFSALLPVPPQPLFTLYVAHVALAAAFGQLCQKGTVGSETFKSKTKWQFAAGFIILDLC